MARLTGLAAVVVTALLTVPTASTASAVPVDGWASLQVPHLAVPPATAGGYHYPTAVQLGRNRLRYPSWGVTSMAVTADAAIVESATPQIEFGPLLELPTHGRAGRVLERHPLGIPIADPVGHVAFWSHLTAHRSRLVAYDTGSRTKRLGPKVDSDTRIFAVDGDTAYLLDLYGAVLSWHPGDPTLTPVPGLESEWFLTDVHGARALFTDFDHHGLVVADLAGATLGTVPHAFYATFSPDGSALVAWTRDGYRAYDAATLQELPLQGLHGREGYQARWSPGGALVLTLARSGSHPLAHDVPLGFAACSLPEGRCHALPGRSSSQLEPFYESTALGQLIDLIGD
jgi:hypothetical protein